MALPKRKSMRLKEYDYSSNGAYFVTICTHNRACLFGEIRNGTTKLSPFGEIAHAQILHTHNKRLHDGVSIDKYIVMPNHVHLIVNVGSRLAVTASTNAFSKPIANSISTIIGGYKSAVTRNIHMQIGADLASHVPTIWQPRFHEHVIRNEKSYQEIWEYIDTNLLKWELDCYHAE